MASFTRFKSLRRSQGLTVHSAELISTFPQQLFMPSTVPSPAAFTEGAQSVSSRAHAVGKGPAAGCGVGLSLYYCVYVRVCLPAKIRIISMSAIYFSVNVSYSITSGGSSDKKKKIKGITKTTKKILQFKRDRGFQFCNQCLISLAAFCEVLEEVRNLTL